MTLGSTCDGCMTSSSPTCVRGLVIAWILFSVVATGSSSFNATKGVMMAVDVVVKGS